MSVKTVEKMMEWLEENNENSHALPQTVGFVGFSEYSCSAKFRETAGVTYREYLAERGISGTSAPKDSTSSAILDIAFDCGFSSIDAFSCALGRGYACLPNVYKKNQDIYGTTE